MDSISQKNIDSIIEILRKDATKEDPSQRLQLANALEKAEIIPALYIMTYLEAVDKIRKDTGCNCYAYHRPRSTAQLCECECHFDIPTEK